MYPLAFPKPRVRPNFFTEQRHFHFDIFLLLLILACSLAATGCSPLNSAAAPLAMMISGSLPPGTVGQAYSAAISVSGGTAPYSFRTTTGQLPPGLAINATTGAISGTPQTSGSYQFAIFVADHSGNAAGTQTFAITVKPPVVPPPAVEVTVSPASVTLAPGGSYQFAAMVSNSSNPAVVWSASAGAVTSMGVFTAPTANAAATIRLTATSKADPSKQGTASIIISPSTPVIPPSPLTLASASLPDAIDGVPYTAALHASGGKAPLQWKVSSGSLPGGLQLGADGVIQGITHQSGASTFTASVSDAAGQTAGHQFSITAVVSNTGNFDGPAELPRIYVKSSLADTPAPGVTHAVSSTSALQAAIDSAKCGDTISLKAGETFAGHFVLSAKSCDDNHWIIIRTSAPDSALPPEGTRITPCYAGVSSLPGRPALSCASTANVLAKLVFPDNGSGPIVLADGANHYRLVGLEITRLASKSTVYSLVANSGASDHIIYDRVWMHGTAQDETTRGMNLAGSTYTAIVDSFFSDFHCVAVTGACGDSQAIAGGLGDRAMGPHKIVNNYLEAAGENIIFGGGEATRTPEDIEIRGNFFFKPLIWMSGTPGFVGGHDGHPFIVKNHLELKNGARVLVEGNVMENSWGGFTQAGFSILLTPKNQNGLCPLCVVHDITIRYGTIRYVGNGITVGNGASDSGALSQGAWNESLHDLIITGISAKTYNGGGHLIQESNSNLENPIHDVVIAHVTGLLQDDTAAALVIGGAPDHPLAGFSWLNNIFTATAGGILSTGGGATNCAYPGFGNGALGKLERCFKPYTFSGNVLIGATGPWPADNKAPATTSAVMFSGSNEDDAANLALQAASPFRNSGTDGKDPGADVAAVEAAVAGVAP